MAGGFYWCLMNYYNLHMLKPALSLPLSVFLSQYMSMVSWVSGDFIINNTGASH